jgi:hypothetical protein
MTAPNQFSAAASALGYFYQARYALLLLLRAEPGQELSIERLDDVAFEQGGDAIELLQFKHSIQRQAGLSDSSPDLWKSLRIWSVAVSQRQIDLDTVQLSLVTTATAAAGSAASLLRPDEDRDESAALELLLAASQRSESEGNAAAYIAFRALSPEQQRALLSRVQVLDHAPNVLDLREQIKHALTFSARPEHIDALCDRVEGWWFRRVVAHLAADVSLGSRISQNEVRSQINDIRDQLQPDNLPVDFPEPIEVDETALNQDERVFVEQLRLVMVETPRVKKALSDYYRAFRQRSKWVDDDLLLDSDLQSYEKKLVDEWERLFGIMREDLGVAAAEADKQRRGRALFNVLDTGETHFAIRPRFVERYVMRGSYHILANALRVGWHPDFRERLLRAFQQVGQVEEPA